VNEHILGLLPDGAIFVNVGRGALVDETALPDLAQKESSTSRLMFISRNHCRWTRLL